MNEAGDATQAARGPARVVVDDDDDFVPEATTSRRGSTSKPKGKAAKPAVTDKPITAKDERKGRGGPSFPGRRGVLNNDGDDEDEQRSSTHSPRGRPNGWKSKSSIEVPWTSV